MGVALAMMGVGVAIVVAFVELVVLIDVLAAALSVVVAPVVVFDFVLAVSIHTDGYVRPPSVFFDHVAAFLYNRH